MRLRDFLKSLGLIPIAAVPGIEASEKVPPLQTFRYQTERGRPMLLFIINGTRKEWYYWAFEQEWVMPEKGKWQYANCIGAPKNEGWVHFEGVDPECRLSAFLTKSVRENFPDYTSLMAHYQLQVLHA